MTPIDCLVAETPAAAMSLTPVRGAAYDAWLDGQAEVSRAWLMATDFKPTAGATAVYPTSADGGHAAILTLGEKTSLWDWAAPPVKLPKGTYRLLETDYASLDADNAALAWALGSYRFRSYAGTQGANAKLVWPPGCDRDSTLSAIKAVYLARDLINTPANDLGPVELAAVARRIADAHDAACTVISGDSLLVSNYPAIHRVGQGSRRDPQLIDLRWGAVSAPKVTIIGKGVCFDTGGLDLKPSSAMRLMKKDMGGGAIALGLAQMVMAAGLPVRLRLLIPAVENSVSATAMRPLDIIRMRSGITVEVGNTDAEGRLILADALFEASSEHPDLLIDCATLTGAARVAVGTEIPAMFCNDDAIADALLDCGARSDDPLWRLPLWQPYRRFIEGKIADLNNDPASPFGGAITAALFLSEFVEPKIPWIHLDMMGWNLDNRPGRPEGGEAMGMRALFAFLKSRYPL